MDYRFLLDLAIILFATKMMGLLMKKLGLPQVVGALIAGILIGPAIWEPMTGGQFVPVRPSDFLKFIAELGVIMIMFEAGLETDMRELKKCGLKAAIIAVLGVIVPLGLGFAISIPFFGLETFEDSLSCIFMGVVITATSVSITVETLRELGKLKGRTGTVILSAAILDDVIGIIVLSFVTGLKNPGETPTYMLIVNTLLFFAIGIGLGIGLNFLFKWLGKKYPHTRRVPIFGLVICFVYSFCAVRFFGIADITGAYLAGIMLSNLKDETGYIERKIDISSYMIFSPVFFANLGIETDFSGFRVSVLLFCLLFILAGLGGKVLGCGVGAKVCGFSVRDSMRIGVGMMARGEVALIVIQRGIEAGIIDKLYLTPVILLVIISSLITPILLKLLFKNEQGLPLSGPGGMVATQPPQEASTVGAAEEPAEEPAEPAVIQNAAAPPEPVTQE